MTDEEYMMLFEDWLKYNDNNFDMMHDIWIYKRHEYMKKKVKNAIDKITENGFECSVKYFKYGLIQAIGFEECTGIDALLKLLSEKRKEK